MDRLIGAISLALFGVLFLVPAWKIPSDGTGVWAVMRVVFLLFGFILLFYSAAITAEVLIDRVGHLLLSYAERTKRMSVITPDSERLRLIASMRPDQTEVWLKQSSALIAIPGVAGAIPMYDVDGMLIPFEFVQEFLDGCDGESLAPVRQWADGSNGRTWAQQITKFYVSRGLARPAAGNSAASWRVPFEDAMGWFGLIME